MKHILFFFLAVFSLCSAHAQTPVVEASKAEYKIVFQLSTSDTLAHKALMKQISNITTVEPATQIEVVCHGPGLQMLQKGKSTVADKIEGFGAKGIQFLACEFSMKERNVSKEDVLPTAGYVKAGILHIVGRQSEGWYYIKSGF